MADRKHDTMLVQERPVKGDVQAPTWAGYASGTDHAFLVPVGIKIADHATDGKIESACGMTLDAGRLAKGTRRCKRCASQFTAEPKKGRGLSEPQVELVATGSVDGAPREAEARREAEIRKISGDAGKRNAEIVKALRAGNVDLATAIARNLDESAQHMPTGRRAGKKGAREAVPSAPSAVRPDVPAIDRLSAGQRSEARIDGMAMVHGPDRGTQTLDQWQAAQTGKPGRTTLDVPKGREHVDRGALAPLTVHDPKLYRACAERQCLHIVGDLPADRKEAITYREYSKLGRKAQNRHWVRVNKIKASIKRAAEHAARQPVKIHPGRKSEGDRPKIEELMKAPGRFAEVDWTDRQGMSVR